MKRLVATVRVIKRGSVKPVENHINKPKPARRKRAERTVERQGRAVKKKKYSNTPLRVPSAVKEMAAMGKKGKGPLTWGNFPIVDGMRKCAICEKDLPIEQYHAPKAPDGRRYPSGKCGDCTRKITYAQQLIKRIRNRQAEARQK